MIFYRNGFIIKSDTGFDYPNKLKNYSGIAKGLTWPLEELTDEQLKIMREKNKENKKALSLIDREISSRR